MNVNYKVVVADSPKTLETAVNDLLNQGYLLAGSLQIVPEHPLIPFAHSTFAQSMFLPPVVPATTRFQRQEQPSNPAPMPPPAATTPEPIPAGAAETAEPVPAAVSEPDPEPVPAGGTTPDPIPADVEQEAVGEPAAQS